MIRVLILCSGLGRVRRGFESFAEECYEAMRDDPRVVCRIVRTAEFQHRLADRGFALSRHSPLTQLLARGVGKDPYTIEQLSYVMSCIPHILLFRPEVIFFSDGTVGNALWHLRSLLGLRCRLLLSNGAPFSGPHTPRCDFIQQLTPAHFENSDPGRSVLVPYGFTLPASFNVQSCKARNELRRRLKLPSDRHIILSVAALNASHKRLDSLVREVSEMPHPRPFLLMLGQREAETMQLETMASALLDADSFAFRSVSHHEMSDYYSVSDILVLSSLSEGLPRCLVEGLGHGLLCVVHDNAVNRFVLGEHGTFGDLSQAGVLSGLLTQALAAQASQENGSVRWEEASRRFSWGALRDSYIQMFERCRNISIPGEGASQ